MRKNCAHLFRTKLRLSVLLRAEFIICPIAIAYSMEQIIKSVCVCQCVCVCACVCVCVCVRLRARSHFLIDFHQNWHRRKNPEK